MTRRLNAVVGGQRHLHRGETRGSVSRDRGD